MQIANPKLQLQKILYRRDFKSFAEGAWPHIDGATFQSDIIHQGLCTYLQAVGDNTINDVVINVPPGAGKSLYTTGLFPAWLWLTHPWLEFIVVTHSLPLASEHVSKLRKLVDTDWYRSIGGPELIRGKNRSTLFGNKAGGIMKAFGRAGGITGYRAHVMILDDLIKADDGTNKAIKQKINNWWKSAASSRFHTTSTYPNKRIFIGQRIAEDDPPGYQLATGAYEHYNLYLIKEKNACKCRACVQGGVVKFIDPRADGECLNDKRWSPEKVAEIKQDEIVFRTQYQQQPTSANLGFVKWSDFANSWVSPGESRTLLKSCIEDKDTEHIIDCLCDSPLTMRWDRLIMIVDATYRGKSTSDDVGIVILAKKGVNTYVIDSSSEKMYFDETCEEIRRLKKKWPMVRDIIIESKANGDAIISTLKKEIPGVRDVSPGATSKIDRFQAVTYLIKAGNLRVGLHASFREKLINQAVSFPRSAHDDLVDCLAYGLAELYPLKKQSVSLLSVANRVKV